MEKIKIFFIVFITASLMISCNKNTQTNTSESEHPCLIITKKGVQEIRSQLGNVPLFDKTLEKTKKEIDTEIETGIHMPKPKDYSGGYSHERHKKNFLILQKAGVLFQILEDEKYANYVKDVLFSYADLYPTLPKHPQTRSYARGKLFWQCLNDSNWLVYTSQAYDCIYDWLSEEERTHLENKLFKPFANFISAENPQFFNRVHNHSTWGNSAVGMIALVMGDDELLNKALYGLKTDGLDKNMKDNDGGFIKTEGQKVGFFANIDEPFSPDGYYTEGPYYQRYAMYPFLIFAQALHNVKPELKVFEYKNGVLLKAVNALINLSDSDGEFFPLNDGQKGMSYYSRELVTAVNIAYHFGGNNPELLTIAKKQNRVVLDDTGLAIAKGIRDNKTKPFQKKSIELRDGAKGKQGAVGILRNQNIELVYKYAAQGLSHGHYDKLSFSLNENGHEIIQDYGLARFVNIEQKGGGNYLKENTSWAKQTIAHNTIIQDEKSHFGKKYKIASLNHSEKYLFDSNDLHVQVASAKEKNAYPGTELHRTMAMISNTEFEVPFILDIVKIESNKKHQYDLPYYYLGQIISTNFNYEKQKTLKPLGTKNGYQHLWNEASGKPESDNIKFSWLNNGRFYTLTTTALPTDEILFTRIGANDPNFNLRNDPGFMIRRNIQNTTYASIIEPHGNYSTVSEFSVNSKSNIASINLIDTNSNYTVLKITDIKNNVSLFILSNSDAAKNTHHKLIIENKVLQWEGPYYYTKF